LDEIQKKVLRVFLLAFHSHLYSFALSSAHATSYVFTVQFLYAVKEKGGKPEREPCPFSLV
jgi:hypothetical protein